MEDTFPPTNVATLQQLLLLHLHLASSQDRHHRLMVEVKEDLIVVVVSREAIRARDPTASPEVMIEEEDTSRLTTEVVIVNKEATLEVVPPPNTDPTEISTAVIRDLMTLRTLVEEEVVTERKAHQSTLEAEVVMLQEEAMEEAEVVVITTNIVAEEAPTRTQDAMTMVENLRTRLATLVEEEATQEVVATGAMVAIVRVVTVKVAIAAKAAIVAVIVVMVAIATMLQEETLITSCSTSTQTVKVG